MTPEQMFKRINELLAESARIGAMAEKLGQKYTDATCPYKSGDRIQFKTRSTSPTENGIVSMIHFSEHSNLPWRGNLIVHVCSKNWEWKRKRNMVLIKELSQIVKENPCEALKN